MLGVNIGFCCHKSLEAKGEKCISRPILRISLYPREAKEMKEALLTLEFSTLWNAVVCSGCWRRKLPLLQSLDLSFTP